MADFPYQFKFPCPECKGILTMHVPQGTGQCPLCQSQIEVEFTVQTLAKEETEPALGWDRRAFRRPAGANKPMWEPLHQPAE